MRNFINWLSLCVILCLTLQCHEKDKLIKMDQSSNSSIVDYCQNGERNGLCIGYYSTGSIHDSTYYKNGVWEGRRIVYYPNGNKEYIANCKKGFFDGKCIRYYKNNKVARVSNYKSHQEIGWVNEFDTLGRLIVSTEYCYVNDTIIMNSIKEFLPNGKLNYSKSFFAKVKLNKDTVKLGENILISARLYGSSRERYGDKYNLKLGVGDFNEKFILSDSNKIDIIITDYKDSTSLSIEAKKKGLNILRGYVANDSTFKKGIPYPCLSRKTYFTVNFFVK